MMTRHRGAAAEPPLSSVAEALSVSALFGWALALIALFEHLVDGALPAGQATVHVAAAAAFGGLLMSVALFPLLLLFRLTWKRGAPGSPLLWSRLFFGLFVFLAVEVAWCLAVYWYDPRLPLKTPQLKRYAAGLLPSLIVAALAAYFLLRRALSARGALRLVLGYAALAFGFLLWLPRFNYFWMHGVALLALSLPALALSMLSSARPRAAAL